MYFKKLQMVGFKSFLNKTVCNFEKGVTAIVGPNGCGKSNIVDAIKWVFGEQSTKSMRSSSMQDVIFNGTEKYDPVNLAEVSLTLSNEDRLLPVDYDEVTITRRLFRDGESEYLINKTPVRLMDVKNLLMGTGLGTSSYSIVEQGKMDMILSSKPEERRFVFEEASGITRYKSKKREAVLKLERTQENLTRLNDIIREVERQIKTIERQARKADRYKNIYAEMKQCDLNLAGYKFQSFDKDDGQMGSETADRQKQNSAVKKEIDFLSEELAKERESYNRLMEELQEAQSEVVKITANIDKNVHVISVNLERANELEKYTDRMQWEISSAKSRKERLTDQLIDLEVKCKDLGSRRAEKEKDFADTEHRLECVDSLINEKQEELKVAKNRSLDLVTEETSVKNNVIRMNADIDNESKTLAKLEGEMGKIQVDMGNIDDRLRQVEEEYELGERYLSDKRREFDELSREFMDRQGRMRDASGRRALKERKLNEIKPRIEFLEKLIDEHEGMPDSVRTFINEFESRRDHFYGVYGILSDLVNLKPGYEESFEAVMGDFSHALVVDDRQAAGNVTDFLRDRKLGSVNFIILNELDEFDGEYFETNMPDVAGNISEILSCDEKYLDKLGKLLNNLFVSSKSREQVEEFVKSNKAFKGKILCENGEVFQKGYHRTSNFSGKEEYSIFSRKNKLQALISEEKEIRKELEEVIGEINGIEAWLEENTVKRGKLEDELKTKHMEFADISIKRNMMREKKQELTEEVRMLEAEVKEISLAVQNKRDEVLSSKDRLAVIENEKTLLGSTITEAETALLDLFGQKENATRTLSEVKAELAGLRKEEVHFVENFEREKKVFSGMDDDLTEKLEGVLEALAKCEKMKDESKNLENKNKELSVLKEQLIFQGAQKKGQKDRLAGEISVKERELKEKEEKLEDSRNISRDLEIRRKEIEYKKSSLVQKIFDAYKVNIQDFQLTLPENFDPEAEEMKINELKDKLERMGEVSLGAVEEHKQLEERFAFLTQQRDDLAKSREDIMNAILKINRTTRKMFMETFEAIRGEFNKYYKMLFNGGRAELVLEDEHNVLECGIDIVVRPPGKKLQNITLLSGGEKAMTAIALIFAIFKVNPSPFCVLDEIDAPLDESNVVTFSNVLKDFLQFSQFIIVTHNRMTIQLADVLYGITMQEKGVSKIVGVKMKNEEAALEETKETVAA